MAGTMYQQIFKQYVFLAFNMQLNIRKTTWFSRCIPSDLFLGLFSWWTSCLIFTMCRATTHGFLTSFMLFAWVFLAVYCPSRHDVIKQKEKIVFLFISHQIIHVLYHKKEALSSPYFCLRLIFIPRIFFHPVPDFLLCPVFTYYLLGFYLFNNSSISSLDSL